MKDKATKPPFLTGFMIAVKNQTVNHTPNGKFNPFWRVLVASMIPRYDGLYKVKIQCFSSFIYKVVEVLSLPLSV